MLFSSIVMSSVLFRAIFMYPKIIEKLYLSIILQYLSFSEEIMFMSLMVYEI
jgi:hypothetical protein